MAAPDRRVREVTTQVRRGSHLSRMRPRTDERLVEGCRGAEHGVEAHGADEVSLPDEPRRIGVHERRDRRHQLGAVQQGQALLRLQLHRFQAGLRQRF